MWGSNLQFLDQQFQALPTEIGRLPSTEFWKCSQGLLNISFRLWSKDFWNLILGSMSKSIYHLNISLIKINLSKGRNVSLDYRSLGNYIYLFNQGDHRRFQSKYR